MKSAHRSFHGKAAPILGAAFVVGALMTGLALTGCQKDRPPADPAQVLVDKGRRLYTLRCASCHNPGNPAVDGALGPAVAGSSRELLDARLNHRTYPDGYTPKRTTNVMQRLPHTPEELDAMHAFLNAL
jgi:mono/diheme cytochrome c family protein